MKKIGFIGAYDKIDLIIYIAKILCMLKKRVLVIDATINQKARYIVPVINPTKSYVTEYEEIDIAVGFQDENEIKKYLGILENNDLQYDFILIDVDNNEAMKNFNIAETQKKYFVTSFDIYSLKRGIEIISNMPNVINMTKILFSEEILKEEDDYLNFLSLGLKVVWNEYRIYFPIENGDLSVIHENQRIAKIKFKRLSVQYKDSLCYIATEILDETSEGQIRKVIKAIERGV